MTDRYDEYERKVRSAGALVRRGRGFVRAHRGVILAVLSVLVLLTAALLILTGMMVGGTQADTVSLGAPPDASTTVLLGRASYEYRRGDGVGGWSSLPPREPGLYELRAVTKRAFGIRSYGDPVAFTLMPRPLTVQPTENGLVWGDPADPYASDLVPGDSIFAAEFDVGTSRGCDALYTVRPESVVVRDADGRDVTSSYDVQAAGIPVTYLQREVEVTYPDVTKVYDGLPIRCGSGELTKGTLAHGDMLIAGAEDGSSYVGRSNVTPVLRVMHTDGTKLTDVTRFYAVSVAGGHLTVTPRRLTIRMGSASATYSSYPLTCLDWTTVGDSLLPGHTLEIKSSSSLTDVGTAPNTADGYTVWNSWGVNVTDCFELTFLPGTLTVTPCRVSVTMTGGTYVYTGQPISPTVVSVEGLPYGITFYPREISSLTNVGRLETAQVLSWEAYGRMDGEDPKNYEVVTKLLTPLVIDPCLIVFDSLPGEKIYDGIPLRGVDVGVRLLNPPPEGMSFVVDQASERTDVGSVRNRVTRWHVTSVTGETLPASNFNVVQRTEGILTVERAEVYVTGAVQIFEYDGLPHVGTGIARINDGMDGYGTFTVEIGTTESHVLPGTYPVLTTSVSLDSVIVRNAAGVDVTKNFTLFPDYGWVMTIAPRRLTLETDSLRLTYDGLPKSQPTFRLKEGSLLAGHTLTDLIFSEVTDAGEYPNQLFSWRVTEGSADVSDLYELTVKTGKLTVLPIPLCIRSDSGEKTYDGIPLAVPASGSAAPLCVLVPMPGQNLLEGHELTVTSMRIEADAGEYPNVPKDYRVVDTATGRDVTHNYAFDETYEGVGRLTVRARAITVHTSDGEKVYDGRPLTALSVTLAPGFTLAAGDTLSFAAAAIPYLVEVGQAANKLTPLIRDRSGRDVTGNYVIRCIPGRLTVTPRPLDLLISCDKYYDGTSLSNNDLVFSGENGTSLVAGHTVKLETWQYSHVTNAGKYTSLLGANKTVTILVGDKDVTDCYRIDNVRMTVTIRKRPITICCNGTFAYDGTAHQSNVVTVLPDGMKLVDGDTIGAVTEGSLVGPGTAVNTIKSFYILKSNRLNVTNNYEVTVLQGRLTVTIPEEYDTRPRVSVVLHSKTLIYDGFDAVRNLSATFEDLPKGFTAAVTSFRLTDAEGRTVREAVHAGTYTLTCDEVIIRDPSGQDVSNSFRILTEESGTTLIILPRKITLTSAGAAKMSDGLPLTADSVTITAGMLASLDELEYTTTGHITQPGSTDNTFDFAILRKGQDVTADYDVTLVYGLLTVEE